MTVVAAAVVGVAVVGGAVIAAQGAKSAAEDQANAAYGAQSIQQQEFNTIQGEYAPARNLGYGADSLLAQLYGLPNPNSNATTAGYPANGVAPALTGGNGPTPYYANGGGSFGGSLGPGQSGFNLAPGVAANTVSGSGAPGTAYGVSQAPTTPGAGSTNANGIPINPATGLPGNAPAGAGSAYAGFYNSPGYQFTLGTGEQAVNRNAAATGGLYSTNTLTAENNYAQGAASTQYNNYVQQLLSLSGIGGAAVAGTANAATNAGNNISSAELSAGNANASGVLGSGGAASGALSGIGSAFGNSYANNPSGWSNAFGGSNSTANAFSTQQQGYYGASQGAGAAAAAESDAADLAAG